MAAISKRAALLAASIGVAIAIGFGGAAVAGAIRAQSPQITAFRGARLGMSPRDVRDHFEPLGPGRWQTQTATAPGGSFPASPERARQTADVTLAWAADGGDTRARFEFHAGMLVAVRTALPAASPLAAGAALETSPAAVLTRAARAPGEISLTILARDCPTHAVEVQRALAAGGDGPR